MLEARPFFMAARRAAICSLSESEDALENPFSGAGSLGAARDSVVLLGEAGGRGERGEGAARVVATPGLTLRGAEGAGTGGLTVGAGLNDPLDFCGRKLEDETFDVRFVGRASVVGLLVPATVFPRAEVGWAGVGGGLEEKDDVGGTGDGISDDAERWVLIVGVGSRERVGIPDMLDPSAFRLGSLSAIRNNLKAPRVQSKNTNTQTVFMEVN